MPTVVLTGARQTGKSTLAQAAEPVRRYVSLDDFDVLDAARRQPEVLTGTDAPVTLDEVQRAPDLLREVKMAIEVALPQATVHRHLPPPLSEPPFHLRIRLRMRFWSSVQRRPR